jgi:hypothetical protein
VLSAEDEPGEITPSDVAIWGRIQRCRHSGQGFARCGSECS